MTSSQIVPRTSSAIAKHQTAEELVKNAGGFGPLALSLTEEYGLSHQQLRLIKVISKGLSEEQHRAVLECKILAIVASAVGYKRSERLRFIRDKWFPVTGRDSDGHGHINSRAGWREFLQEEFGIEVNRANSEIRGLETWEAAQKALQAEQVSVSELPDGQSRPATVAGRAAPTQDGIAKKMRPAHMSRIGKAGPHGETIAKEILSGKTKPTSRAIDQRARELKSNKETPGLKIEASAKSPPKVSHSKEIKTAPDHPDDPITYERSKYRDNEKVTPIFENYKSEIDKLRAAARRYKGCIDRLGQIASEGMAHNRNYPSQIHFLFTMWKEENDFDFDQSVHDAEAMLAEATKTTGETLWPLLHGPFVEPKTDGN